jgi:hypothetical protein
MLMSTITSNIINSRDSSNTSYACARGNIWRAISRGDSVARRLYQRGTYDFAEKEESMGRYVAGGHHPAKLFETTYSEGGSVGDVAGLQNQTPCGTRTRTATLGSHLINLQTRSHRHVFRVRKEVAAGRSLSTQTVHTGCGQIEVRFPAASTITPTKSEYSNRL